MGRDKRNEHRKEHFAKLLRATMETEAWRTLSPTAQALYPWLRLEWRGPQFNNNGKIRLSVRQAAERVGVSLSTASKAFHDLQAKGFIRVTRPARLGVGGQASSPLFELTELAMPSGEEAHGSKLFREWRSGEDFAVQKANAHNPRGINGKRKSYPKNDDSTVIEFETSKKRAS